MLDPSQQRFPDELEQMVTSASAAWDDGNADIARDKLAEALRGSARAPLLLIAIGTSNGSVRCDNGGYGRGENP